MNLPAKAGSVLSRLLSAITAGADAPKASVSFADAAQSTITLQATKADPHTAQATFVPVMRNDGAAEASLCFKFEAQNDKNVPVKIFLDPAAKEEKYCVAETIGNTQFHSYPLRLRPEDPTRPIAGYLIGEVSQKDWPKTILAKPVRLVPPVKPRLSQYLFWIPFGVAALSILLAAMMIRQFGRRSRMGSATWDFSQSWASNLTIGGTVLTALLGFAGLPEYGVYMSKSAYTELSLLFGALVMLAPAAYNFTRRSITVPVPDPDDPTNTSGTRLEGAVYGFLLASFVTLWGVFGQLFTVALVLRELVEVGPLPSFTGFAFQVLLVVVGVLLLVYSIVTVYFTVKKQVKHHENTLTARMDAAAAAEATQIQKAAIAAQKPVLPKWALL
jgi:hypothetical protein